MSRPQLVVGQSIALCSVQDLLCAVFSSSHAQRLDRGRAAVRTVLTRVRRFRERQSFGFQPVLTVVSVLPPSLLIELIGQLLDARPDFFGRRFTVGLLRGGSRDPTVVVPASPSPSWIDSVSERCRRLTVTVAVPSLNLP